jgi:hypothetical protein
MSGKGAGDVGHIGRALGVNPNNPLGQIENAPEYTDKGVEWLTKILGQ